MEIARLMLTTGDESRSQRPLEPDQRRADRDHAESDRLDARWHRGRAARCLEAAGGHCRIRRIRCRTRTGPPSIHKPSWELAGEALTCYDAEQARAAFERALVQHPGRVAALSGLKEAVAVQGDILKNSKSRQSSPQSGTARTPESESDRCSVFRFCVPCSAFRSEFFVLCSSFLEDHPHPVPGPQGNERLRHDPDVRAPGAAATAARPLPRPAPAPSSRTVRRCIAASRRQTGK